jgi:hypothetical protein
VILGAMEPEVVAALIAGGAATLGTLAGTLGSQWLAGRREAARDKAQAEREERTQRWDTNRERLIELRALLDQAGVKLIAFEKAVGDTHGNVMVLLEAGVERRTETARSAAAVVPSGTEGRIPPPMSADLTHQLQSLDRDLDELEGRLALRIGATAAATRSFTLACHALTECYQRLGSVQMAYRHGEVEKVDSSAVQRLVDRGLRDARNHRREFFEQARQLIGVQDVNALPPAPRPPDTKP